MIKKTWKKLLAGICAAAMIMTGISCPTMYVSAEEAGTAQSATVIEENSITYTNPVAGTITLSEEERAFYADMSSAVIVDIVFKYNNCANKLQALFTIQNDANNYYTISHNPSTGMITNPVTGFGGGWKFTADDKKIQDNQYHKLTIGFSKDFATTYYYLDGKKVLDFGNGSGNGSWKNNFVNGFAGLTDVSKIVVGGPAAGASYGNAPSTFDGLIKSVKITKGLSEGTTTIVNLHNEISEEVRAEFEALYAECEALSQKDIYEVTTLNVLKAALENYESPANEWGYYNAIDALTTAKAGLVEIEIVEPIGITATPTKTVYFTTDIVDLENIVSGVVLDYNNGATEEITDYIVGDVDLTTPGKKTVKVSNDKFETSFEVLVVKVYEDSYGTYVYASDIPYDADSKAGWGDIGINVDCSGSGSISLTDGTSEKVYEYGLGCHATGNIHYTIKDYSFVAFSSDYGIDDVQRNNTVASVIFKVLLDGNEVIKSDVMKGSTPLKSTGLIDLTNVNKITLNTDENGGNGSDHSVWGDAKFYLTKTVAKFTEASASLNGTIGMNFYVQVNDETALEDLSVKLTRGSDVVTGTFTDAYKATDEKHAGQYKFTFDLAAKEMTDEVKAELMNGEEVISTTSLSVKEYADSAKELYAGDAELVALLDAMLDYGTAAQAEFGYNAENPANGDGVLEFGDVTIAANEVVVQENIETLDVTSVTLLLESDTTLRFYMTMAEGASLESYDAGDYTLKEKDAYVYADVTDIAAKDLDESYTLTVTDENGAETKVTYSPLNYAKAVVESDSSDTLKTVAKALYLYNQAANVYFE